MSHQMDIYECIEVAITGSDGHPSTAEQIPPPAGETMSRTVANEAWLDADPFRRWLRERRRSAALQAGLDENDDDVHVNSYHSYTAMSQLGEQLKLSAKYLKAYLDDDLDKVAFTTADRLISEEGTYSMQEVFGDEYEKIDLSLKNVRYHCPRCGIDMMRKAALCGFCAGEESEHVEQR